jgi:CDP-L-myo-inositol myo-inositolphosphotransferase
LERKSTLGNNKDMPKAVILAAGHGKRLLPHTEERPKPLILVSGRPILEHVIRTLKSVGIKEFILITGYLCYAIQRYFGDGSKLGVNIQYVENPSYPRGNATSVAVAQKLLGNDEVFFLSMADHLMDRHIVERALKNIDRQPLLCVDMTPSSFFHVKEATTVLVGSDGYIKNIGKNISEWNGLDTGLFLLDTAIFDVINRMESQQAPLVLSQCMGEMIKSCGLWACDVSGFFWLDIDTQKDIALANEKCDL